MKITRKKLVLMALCIVLLCPLLYGVYAGCQVVRLLQLFGAEDQIAYTYGPVVEAIYKYAEEQGRPPHELTDLVPNALAAIPACTIVREVRYRVAADGKEWRLDLRSDAYGERRTYCWRSDNKYTPEEEQRIYLQYHGGWTVFKDK